MVTGMRRKAKRSKRLPLSRRAGDPRSLCSFQFLHTSKTWASGKQAHQMLQLWVRLSKRRPLFNNSSLSVHETVSLHSGAGRSSLDGTQMKSEPHSCCLRWCFYITCMRIMLQYEHSKANIYTYIFQDESKQFLNKLLEFSVSSKERCVYVLGWPLSCHVPHTGGWYCVVFRVFYLGSRGTRYKGTPSTCLCLPLSLHLQRTGSTFQCFLCCPLRIEL